MKTLPVLDRPSQWAAATVGRRSERTFRIRHLVQVLFSVLCILIGVRLARFYTAAEAGVLPLPERPPGVDAFLPISGLMGILDWLYQGTLNRVHPAASILVLVALATAVGMRKGFCSWVCPVGLASELLGRFGRWSFGRNFKPWRWLDVPLRSLKYVLLAFFLGAVLAMTPAALQSFIQSPYNQVADVKMGLFFLDLSRTGIIVMGVLLLGSVFIEGMWCRYLCPYGALLGLVSWFSPTRIVRNDDVCVGCTLCDRACPARLGVSGREQVRSPECTGCMDCVAACPVEGALDMRTMGRRRVSPLRMAATICGLFLAGWLGAAATGNWANDITDAAYVEHIQAIHSSVYGHPGR